MKALLKQNLKLKELVDKVVEISTFYVQILNDNAVFLHLHGINASKEDIEKGKRLRDEFNELRSEVSELERQIKEESES